MARVTAPEVKEIMDNCTVDDAIVDTFILAATSLIDKVFASDTELGTDLLKEIERWYTAHLLASTLHRMASDEKVDDASIKFTGYWGKGLDSTPYGQMVQQLDITGKIGRAGKTAASIKAVESFDE
jgi:hypothetical protein